MRELLEKWTTLEPERCQGAYNFTVMTSVGWQQADRLPGILLSAVIEAVEARGWYWDARSQGGSSHRFYTCTVEDSVAHGEFGEPVTKPLLAAYLAALEAEGATIPPAVES